jgi:subtilisin family serine protease
VHLPKITALCAGSNLLTPVLKAIDYAASVWGVDIISMSFGFEEQDDTIEAALVNAERKDVLLIAAASGVGRDMVNALSWPAARQDNVMCIYATDGEGNPYPENPRWRKDNYHFATIWVMVPGWSPPAADGIFHKTHRSGTSIATPVAAGIAACVLNLSGGWKHTTA